MTPTRFDFAPLHAAMRQHVDDQILAGVSHAVLKGRDLVDLACVGWADRERQVPLRVDHIFRIFSNTKLVTSCAVLLLLEEGRFALDDPIERWIPQLGKRRVLKPGATSLADSEPARGPITIRHLLSHGAGLSTGLLDPGSLLSAAYNERDVLNPNRTLAEMMDCLAELPLLFHPGANWTYSVATDVLGRLVELVSGERLDTFLRARIFAPLGMVDTGFVVPLDQQHRIAGHYARIDPVDPTKRALARQDVLAYPGANLRPVSWLNAGAGLVSTLPDMLALVRSLLPGGPTLLKPDTIALMSSNQLPHGQFIRFAHLGTIAGKGYGLAGAVTLEPGDLEPPESTGELQWGGVAGSHWWISPRANLAGVLMTHRQGGFWNPYFFEFKQHVYSAAAG